MDSRHIGLKQRFVKGKLTRKSAGALEFRLIDCSFARWARVSEEDLPPEKEAGNYKHHQIYDLFLTRPIHGKPDYYHASLRLGVPDNNPWWTHKLKLGQRYIARAVRYADNTVYVRLEKLGIDAALGANEVPGDKPHIQDKVDLGDRLLVEIIDLSSSTLLVRVSVTQALKTMARKEMARRLNELGQGSIRPLPRDYQYQQEQRDELVGVFGPDLYFSQHLTDWLHVFGYGAIRIASREHLARVCRSNHAPNIFLLSPERLGGDFHTRIPGRVLWLRTANSPTLSPFPAANMRLPLDLHALQHWIDNDDAAAESRASPEPQAVGPPTMTKQEFQALAVQRLAEDYLNDLCHQLNLEGALWVAEEREDVLEIRASSGLDKRQFATLSRQLGQSLLNDAIKNEETYIWETFRTGPLRSIAPPMSDRVLVFPLSDAMNPAGKRRPDRAVAFFFQSRLFPRRAEKSDKHPVYLKIQPHIVAMQALIYAYHLALYNEQLTAFADLGRNSASYLHELGQKAGPIHAFLDAHKNPKEISASEWRDLRRNLRELLDMARSDLSRISRSHHNRVQLKDRLIRLIKHREDQFNRADCSLTLELPDFPMLLAFNPLVVDHVVGNLLDNALHFAGQRAGAGRVTVRVRLDPQGDPERPLLLEVEDNGSGVRASLQHRLFEPRISAKETGTGMGLSIARGFARGIGGDLWLDDSSVRWSVTRFCLRLPIILDVEKS